MTGETNEDSLKDFIPRIIQSVAYDLWYEDNWLKTFKDIGMEAPMVFDFEEDCIFEVNSIDDFINNCRHSNNYDEIMSAIYKIAEDEYDIEIKVEL